MYLEIYRTQLVRVQKNEPNSTRNANPTQPIPYNSGWVSPGYRVEYTPLLMTRVGYLVWFLLGVLIWSDNPSNLDYPIQTKKVRLG